MMTAIVSVQFGAAIAKEIIGEVGAVATVFYRVSFAALLVGAIARPSFRGRSRSDWRLIGAFGLVLAGMNVSYYAALEYLPIGVTVTLEFVGPLTVAIALSRRRIDVFWAVLAGAGLVLLSPLTGVDLDPVGVLLALVAGACWGAYILLSHRTGERFDGLSGLVLALVVSSALTAAPAVATAGTGLFDLRVVGIAITVAVLSSAIPYGAEMEALRTLPPSSFGMLMSLEPAVAALAGAVVLGERLGAPEMGAIALVLMANAGAVASGRSASGDPAPAAIEEVVP